MPVESYSAKRLDELLNEIKGSDVVGLDQLRDIAAFARAAPPELDDAPRKVVAWVLSRQIHSLCDRYDGDAMTAKESESVALWMQTTVRDALLFVGGRVAMSDSLALQLAATLAEFAPAP